VNVGAHCLRSFAAEKFGRLHLRAEQVEAKLALKAGNEVLAVLRARGVDLVGKAVRRRGRSPVGWETCPGGGGTLP
jgi:hypothetical protein